MFESQIWSSLNFIVQTIGVLKTVTWVWKVLLEWLIIIYFLHSNILVPKFASKIYLLSSLNTIFNSGDAVLGEAFHHHPHHKNMDLKNVKLI